MTPLSAKLAALGIEPSDGETFQAVAQKDMEEIESTIGQPLPEQYRSFLGAYGRSNFTSEVNCTPDSEPLYFGWFFGKDELLLAIESLRDTLPGTIIPIAEDGGGNVFCLGVAGNDAGRVYFHNHNLGWRSEAARLTQAGLPVPADIRYRTVHPVAASFDEFILQMSEG
jgi:hypothetical protein